MYGELPDRSTVPGRWFVGSGRRRVEGALPPMMRHGMGAKVNSHHLSTIADSVASE
jgi:hypothetical protein